MENDPRPAGYNALLQRYHLPNFPHWHESLVGKTIRRTTHVDGRTLDSYPASQWPGDTFGDQLEFALKYDGVNLQIMAQLFNIGSAEPEMLAYVRSKPTGKYARRAWYLFELLTPRKLPIGDLDQGNYVDLLNSQEYYTSAGTSIQRQRVRDNLLGTADFCPLIRRTDRLTQFETSDLGERCRQLVADYPMEMLQRALSYLYTKETKSSFEIEHLKPTSTRAERFIASLRLAEKQDFFNKAMLIDLQNQIVDERFKSTDFRMVQNYVGQAVDWQWEKVHFVSPRPADLGALMAGMFASHERLARGGVHPVIHAAVVAYGFVFMHPFEDGNGRIHRFLIHNVLARRGFTPTGIMFPVSAAMLKKPMDYDASLEAFSRPLMAFVSYDLDEQGRMTVHNDTADFYRYIDMTAQAEALFEFVRETIETELVAELKFLLHYDRTKQAIQNIVDMPDRQIDLFIRFCLQNQGVLSKRKREDFFASLTDDEVTQMESAVKEGYERT